MANNLEMVAVGALVAFLLYSMETTHINDPILEQLMDMHNRFRTNKPAFPTQPECLPGTRQGAENQLRDIAYVLHLTHRIREEILSERESNTHEVCHA